MRRILVDRDSSRAQWQPDADPGQRGIRPGRTRRQQADVAYLGAGQLGAQSEDYITEYWSQTVRTVGARRVVLIHWDDFFRP